MGPQDHVDELSEGCWVKGLLQQRLGEHGEHPLDQAQTLRPKLDIYMLAVCYEDLGQQVLRDAVV